MYIWEVSDADFHFKIKSQQNY